jgi:hypothetical protein
LSDAAAGVSGLANRLVFLLMDHRWDPDHHL